MNNKINTRENKKQQEKNRHNKPIKRQQHKKVMETKGEIAVFGPLSKENTSTLLRKLITSPHK